jgi:2-dehydro-3-deoxygluconokinase
MAHIVTLGEALVRLSPPQHQRLEQACRLDVEVGGAELNTAAGLVRLGHAVQWVSRVPDSPLGALVTAQVRAAGVRDSYVVRAADGRCGLYFLEPGAAPRASAIVYDRAGSSMSLARPGEFDWPTIFKAADWFHVSGITAALSASTASVCTEAMRDAKAAGLTVSVDLNYRSKLWNPAEAGRVMAGLLHHADVLIASETDAALLFGIEGVDFAAVAEHLANRFPLRAVATLRREAKHVWADRIHAVGWCGGPATNTEPIDVEVVDRIGTGDAFTAGLIHGLLENDLLKGLSHGTALAALAHTIPGDLPLATLDEVNAVLSGGGLRIRR